jgi:tetratricopeptide (TPR) repeat protein
MPGHVFISHSTRDDALAARLRQALERLGFSTWVDSRQLRGGDQLEPEIRKAIAEASHLVAILSMNAVNSPWLRREIDLGLERAAAEPDFKVIPILVPPLEVTSLDLFFPTEPVAVQFDPARDTLENLLHKLQVALGAALPSDAEPALPPATAPLGELLVELDHLAITHEGAERRASAEAKLRWLRPGVDEVASRSFKIKTPLGAIEAGELKWYLERWPLWPSPHFAPRALAVEEALATWGKLLFATLDVPVAIEVWEAFRRAPMELERCISLYVEAEPLEGASPEETAAGREAAATWLGLPWELLHDERGFLADGARGVRVRRRLPGRQEKAPLLTTAPIRVLVVSPRPEDETAGFLDHRASAKPLMEAFAKLGSRAAVELLAEPTLPGMTKALREAAKAGRPFHAVHFDGHGIFDRQSGLGALCFEDPADQDKYEKRRSQLVDAETLASTLRDFRVPLVVLEACQTAVAQEDPLASLAARLLDGGVASVVAMSHSVLVETARRFVETFYGELATGATVGGAALAAQQRLREDPVRGKTFYGELRMRDFFVPVLFQEALDPQLVVELPGGRAAAMARVLDAESVKDVPEEPKHKFVGRSRQLLYLERLLLRERYVVIVGQGGEGKTTLAAELARWLVLAERFQKAVFVKVEDSLAQTARAVLSLIGGAFSPNFDADAGGDLERGLQLVERSLGERPTLIVVDNVESLLGSLEPDGEATEPEAAKQIFALLSRLNSVCETRLVLTSRSKLGDPFARNFPLGRLSRDEGIDLVGKVLAEEHKTPPGKEQEGDVEALVEAAGGHARALVLLAREAGQAGLRGAAERMQELMEAMEARHPDDRERSLFASVELSLRRLPPATREKLPRLGVFQGGGHGWVIAQVLGLDYEKNEEIELGRQLIEVGLAEEVAYGHVRFDPALCPALRRELGKAEHGRAREAWVASMQGLTGYLYDQKFLDTRLSATVTLLELPNLLAALATLAESAAAEPVVDMATSLEGLLQYLGRPRALACVVEIREAAARRLVGWSQALFEAESATIDRMLEAGTIAKAVGKARSLAARATAAGEAAYPGAAYDLARGLFKLGRALRLSGAAAAALQQLREARERFGRLATRGSEDAGRMVSACLTDSGDCLRDLGRLDEAAAAYEMAIDLDAARNNRRDVARGKAQLGTVRLLEGRHQEALAAYGEARAIFEELGEPGSVATVWHQVGMVHQKAGLPEAAEQAYRQALQLEVRQGDRPKEASTLNQLGNLYAALGRREEAVRSYREVATIDVEVGDLRNEGLTRNNMADQLVRLGRLTEARKELERAIECKRPYGHAALPWTTFAIQHDLERAAGNWDAADKARQQAIGAFLAYRRDGGENHTDPAQLVAGVGAAIAAGEAGAMAVELQSLAGQTALPEWLEKLLPALQQIVAGSRDLQLAEDPRLTFDVTVELRLLLESLQSPATEA